MSVTVYHNVTPCASFLWKVLERIKKSAIYFYTKDTNKNVSEPTDSTGAVTAHYEYAPFGAQTITTGAYAEANPFRFSSEYYDSETKLIYYNYRYYDPQLGRWLSRDPLEEKGGINIYCFICNNINVYDDLGLVSSQI